MRAALVCLLCGGACATSPVHQRDPLPCVVSGRTERAVLYYCRLGDGPWPSAPPVESRP